MLPILLAAGAFATATLQPSSETTSNQESDEDIEKFFLNRQRDRKLLPGKTLISENARIVRPALEGIQHPVDAAKNWEEYQRQYENVAHTLSNANHAGGENARYFRSDINKKRRRPVLPDRESFKEWESVPTAYFEYAESPDGGVYPDIDYSWHDDQSGDAITTPGAPHYIFTPQEFMGNPWGPSGQFYNAGLRTTAQEDLQRDKVPEEIRKKNHVRFYGLPQ
jgi:hypothetical protein